jgi:hypothetical protein
MATIKINGKKDKAITRGRTQYATARQKESRNKFMAKA